LVVKRARVRQQELAPQRKPKTVEMMKIRATATGLCGVNFFRGLISWEWKRRFVKAKKLAQTGESLTMHNNADISYVTRGVATLSC